VDNLGPLKQLMIKQAMAISPLGMKNLPHLARNPIDMTMR
jgi:hypothetical protein